MSGWEICMRLGLLWTTNQIAACKGTMSVKIRMDIFSCIGLIPTLAMLCLLRLSPWLCCWVSKEFRMRSADTNVWSRLCFSHYFSTARMHVTAEYSVGMARFQSILIALREVHENEVQIIQVMFPPNVSVCECKISLN